jgi:RecJ-like exonuclease
MSTAPEDPSNENLAPGDESTLDPANAGKTPCPNCGGTGTLDDGGECPECAGTGFVVEDVGGG